MSVDAQGNNFMKKLKEQWVSLWSERFNDKIRAEDVAIRDYPLLFLDRGSVIFANRDAKIPSFFDIVDFWASMGFIYAPHPEVGGWGRFIRTEIRKLRSKKMATFKCEAKRESEKRQLKKGGRGWLHIE